MMKILYFRKLNKEFNGFDPGTAGRKLSLEYYLMSEHSPSGHMFVRFHVRSYRSVHMFFGFHVRTQPICSYVRHILSERYPSVHMFVRFLVVVSVKYNFKHWIKVFGNNFLDKFAHFFLLVSVINMDCKEGIGAGITVGKTEWIRE